MMIDYCIILGDRYRGHFRQLVSRDSRNRRQWSVVVSAYELIWQWEIRDGFIVIEVF